MKVVLRQAYQGETIRKILEKMVEWNVDAGPFPPPEGLEIVDKVRGNAKSTCARNTYYDVARGLYVIVAEPCRSTDQNIQEWVLIAENSYDWTEAAK